jgi:hypothetical protein
MVFGPVFGHTTAHSEGLKKRDDNGTATGEGRSK